MREFNHQLHIDLWDILAKNPEMTKSQACSEMGTSLLFSCACCDYVCNVTGWDFRHGMREIICNEYCPLKWPEWQGGEYERESPYLPCDWLYLNWRDEQNPKVRSEIAREIRDLPLKQK